MPAMRATETTSPLGPSPRATAPAVSGRMRTSARTTARRSVAALPPTSTMRALPASSRCESSLTGRQPPAASRVRGGDPCLSAPKGAWRVQVALDRPVEAAPAGDGSEGGEQQPLYEIGGPAKADLTAKAGGQEGAEQWRRASVRVGVPVGAQALDHHDGALEVQRRLHPG